MKISRSSGLILIKRPIRMTGISPAPIRRRTFFSEIASRFATLPIVRRGGPSMDWLCFWDPSEGIRTLTLLGDDRYPTTFDEDELRTFTLAHKEFFFIENAMDPYDNSRTHTPFRVYVDILWPS